MVEQLAKRDPVAAADARQPLGDLVVEAELALILEQQQRHCRELLGDGGDLVGQVGARRQAFIGFAVSFGQDDLAVADDGDRRGGDGGVGKRLGDRLVDGGGLLGGERLRGCRRRDDDEKRQCMFEHAASLAAPLPLSSH